MNGIDNSLMIESLLISSDRDYCFINFNVEKRKRYKVARLSLLFGHFYPNVDQRSLNLNEQVFSNIICYGG